jgi:hypothetical protein
MQKILLHAKGILLLAVFTAALLMLSFAGTAFAAGGFDQYGYNDTARIFNGTGSSWCLAGGQAANCMGAYSNDKLLMKWNADWDRGNDENWSNPPYAAWTDNEWNGKGKGGSGAVWHYKIKWVGPCGAYGTPLPDGGYCIWGQFEVLMDQGSDPSYGPGHIWYAKATPNGYGSAQ